MHIYCQCLLTHAVFLRHANLQNHFFPNKSPRLAARSSSADSKLKPLWSTLARRNHSGQCHHNIQNGRQQSNCFILLRHWVGIYLEFQIAHLRRAIFYLFSKVKNCPVRISLLFPLSVITLPFPFTCRRKLKLRKIAASLRKISWNNHTPKGKRWAVIFCLLAFLFFFCRREEKS